MYTYRLVSVGDFEIITKHRTLLFQENGRNNREIDEMNHYYPTWLKQAIARNVYTGWFALFGEQIVAGLGLMFIEWPPHPNDPQSARAYILDVYTDINHRKRGLAKNLLNLAFDEAKNRDIKVIVLHTTEQGRSLYEQLGFNNGNEMMKRL